MASYFGSGWSVRFSRSAFYLLATGSWPGPGGEIRPPVGFSTVGDYFETDIGMDGGECSGPELAKSQSEFCIVPEPHGPKQGHTADFGAHKGTDLNLNFASSRTKIGNELVQIVQIL